MSLQGYSGKSGTAYYGGSVLYEITGWKFEPKATNPAAATNRTSGFKGRVPGVRDSSGSITVKTPAGNLLPMKDGDAILLVLCDGFVQFNVPAIIEGVAYNCQVDAGELVGYDLNFAGTGAWTQVASSSSGS